MAFQKGQEKSGGRRPNTANRTAVDVAKLARDYGRDAIITLAGIMADSSVAAADRARCATILLERGYGRPTLDVNLMGAGLSAIQVETVIINAAAPAPGPVVIDAGSPAALAPPAPVEGLPASSALAPPAPVEGLPASLPAIELESFYRPRRRTT